MKLSLIISFLFVFGITSGVLNAQSVRSLNNDGVDLYEEEKFAHAEIKFKKGVNEAPNNFVANFNLADNFYMQQKYEEAIKAFQNSLDKTASPKLKAKVYHNIGNSLLKLKKIKEAVNAYENSLKLNPNDQETKYNLSYALSLLEKQNQDQNQKNKQNKNKNKKDEKKDKQDKNNDQKQNDQKKKNSQDQGENDKMKQVETKISKAEAERILEALKNNEKDLQKKLRKQKGKSVQTGKDW